MDATDIRILRALQAHGDLPVSEMAGKVGLSHTPYWRRLRKLEADGVIRERAVILDERKLGLTVTVIANLRLREHDEATLEALERAVRDQPEIVECYSMSGESDYTLRVVVASIEDYEAFLKKVLLHLPGVANINSHFALKRIKSTTRLPIR